MNKRKRRRGSTNPIEKPNAFTHRPCRSPAREKRPPIPAALAPTARRAEGELQLCAANGIVRETPAHNPGESVGRDSASLKANMASVLRSNSYRRDLCVSSPLQSLVCWWTDDEFLNPVCKSIHRERLRHNVHA